MGRKDYLRAVRFIRDFRQESGISPQAYKEDKRVIDLFCAFFAENPNFDKNLFIARCMS
jgi:hypothetical protein